MPTSSTATALRMPPALSKAQGKLSSPAPRADFSMMKMAPMEPSRGWVATSSRGLFEAEASRLMLSLANSSMLRPAGNSQGGTLTHIPAHKEHTYTHTSCQPLPGPGAALWAGPLTGQGEPGGGGGGRRRRRRRRHGPGGFEPFRDN